MKQRLFQNRAEPGKEINVFSAAQSSVVQRCSQSLPPCRAALNRVRVLKALQLCPLKSVSRGSVYMPATGYHLSFPRGHGREICFYSLRERIKMWAMEIWALSHREVPPLLESVRRVNTIHQSEALKGLWWQKSNGCPGIYCQQVLTAAYRTHVLHWSLYSLCKCFNRVNPNEGFYQPHE